MTTSWGIFEQNGDASEGSPFSRLEFWLFPSCLPLPTQLHRKETMRVLETFSLLPSTAALSTKLVGAVFEEEKPATKDAILKTSPSRSDIV